VTRPRKSSSLRNAFKRRKAFSLVELLVVVAIIGILASMLLPALSQARAKSQQAFCIANVRQLALALNLYANDNAERLAYNLGATEIKLMLDRGAKYNWANSVLNWELDLSNTNTLLNTEASLGSYVGKSARVFRCPSDKALSSVQRAANWTERSRSISLNAMIGDAGEFTRGGSNINNPAYHQYMRLTDIAAPDHIFTFIEEHPDSINDGYFLNKAYSWEWIDLPASYHDGGASLSFADGHLESRRWQSSSTKKPPKPDGAALPFEISADERADFDWLIKRMSTH
jgi:prepilin-type N-terminal cleavage/methylation domain-containing protein/prepilin-type processing-associated H-X9-DG protein